jgi:hypothetical protein
MGGCREVYRHGKWEDVGKYTDMENGRM